MSDYNPDKWVMLKIESEFGITYKILASWYGGYANGDSWKLSSGTVSMIPRGDTLYEFPQHSGSTYFGAAGNYGMSFYTETILAGFMEDILKSPDASIVVLKYDEIATLEYSE